MGLSLDLETKIETKESDSALDVLTKKIDKLTEAQKELSKEQQKASKESSESISKNTKSIEQSTKATSKLAKGFKGVGLALKAAGIGIALELFNQFKNVLSQNQTVADNVTAVFETISIVFNEVVGVTIRAVKEVSSATNGFESLTNVLKGLGTIALAPLRALFNGLVLAIKQTQLAWEQSFFGDEDPETIKRLNLEIIEISNNLAQVGLDVVDAGKSIVQNFGGAIDEVSAVTTKAFEGIKEVSVEAAFETAKANVQLRNTAELAAAAQQRLIEQYDRQAEKLRQIRDDDTRSISDRIMANEALAKVLDDQEKALIAQANLQIQSAEANVRTNDSIENRVALTEALANKEGILAQVEGFRSEQLSNRNALLRENNALNQAALEGDEERAQKQREFEAELEQNELFKIEMLKQNLATEREQIALDLEAKRQIYLEGTQARVDAEQEYLNIKQELDQEEVNLERAKDKEINRIRKLSTDVAFNTANTLYSGLKAISNNNEEDQKKFAAAEATFSTLLAINKTLAAYAGVPIPGFAFAQAAAIGAVGFLNVRKILNSSSGSQDTTAPTVSAPPRPTAPVDLGDEGGTVPNIEVNNQGVGGDQNAGFTSFRAYVVNQDIEDKQKLNQKLLDLDQSTN